MAKLPRVTQQIFAGSANQDQTSVFGTMKTGNPTYSSDISALMSSTAFSQGWNSAVIAGYAPFMEDMNGVQKVFSQQIAYTLEQGWPEYDAGTTYYTGSIIKVIGSAGQIQVYSSKVDNNVGNPVTNTNYWIPLSQALDFVTETEFETADTQNVKLTGSQTISGEKTFSAPIVGISGVRPFVAKSTTIVKGVTPDISQYFGMDFQDKNNTRLAYLGIAYIADGRKLLDLQRLDENLSHFNVSFPMYVVAPALTANDTGVPTTAWTRTVTGLNYAGAISVSSAAYTAPSRGVLFVTVNPASGGATKNYYVNDMYVCGTINDYNVSSALQFQLSKGDVFTMSSYTNVTAIVFVPYYGG